MLNSLGEQGWEVFSVAQLENSNKVRLAAKRLLSTPDAGVPAGQAEPAQDYYATIC